MVTDGMWRVSGVDIVAFTLRYGLVSILIGNHTLKTQITPQPILLSKAISRQPSSSNKRFRQHQLWQPMHHHHHHHRQYDPIDLKWAKSHNANMHCKLPSLGTFGWTPNFASLRPDAYSIIPKQHSVLQRASKIGFIRSRAINLAYLPTCQKLEHKSSPTTRMARAAPEIPIRGLQTTSLIIFELQFWNWLVAAVCMRLSTSFFVVEKKSAYMLLISQQDSNACTVLELITGFVGVRGKNIGHRLFGNELFVSQAGRSGFGSFASVGNELATARFGVAALVPNATFAML